MIVVAGRPQWGIGSVGAVVVKVVAAGRCLFF